MDSQGEMSRDMPQVARNRKRILDSSEPNEEENSYRRPNLLSEYQESFRSRCGPNKKGFIGAENQSNEIIDQRLADNFEDSLSGLGVNMSNIPFNMSETMLALPSIPVLKQEHSPSPHKVTSAFNTICDDSSQSNTTDRFLKLFNLDSISDIPSPSLHHLLQQHVLFSDTHSNSESPSLSQCENQTEEDFAFVSINESSPEDTSTTNQAYEDNRFQYILGAPTSMATKVNEESITYLNQGQSYEIKVKKLGDITRCQGKYYHSKIRVRFHERRLQFMEKEQISNWKQMRPGERILEVDIPLSYGITDVVQDPKNLTVCEFDWEPSKEVGVYVKVNCISTEFTPKKHGGEKGVPLRLQVENYCRFENGLERVHACACQIKVFKLKGADRKHKQDREKILKRPPSEQDKYLPQCECTILQEMSCEGTDVPPSEDDDSPSADNSNLSSNDLVSPVATTVAQHVASSPEIVAITNSYETTQPSTNKRRVSTPSSLNMKKEDPSFPEGSPENMFYNKPLHTTATATQTQTWLNVNRFSKHASIFANFTGSDILRLSRTELKEICGLADGIRMFNALHARSIIPRLTLYVRPEYEQLYNAVYLENLTWSEFVQRVSMLLQICPENVQEVYLQGPSAINILVTDEVIMNLVHESMLSVKTMPADSSSDKVCLLVRLVNQKNISSDV